MQIESRQHLLGIWRALARHAIDAGKLVPGGTGGLSSIARAERLICLPVPAAEVRSTDLVRPARDQLSEAPRVFGGAQPTASVDAGERRAWAVGSIKRRLDHARSLPDDRPATAVALTPPMLRELGAPAQARGAAREV
ncbi:hypothetical protein [Streptomyces coelicoflavus]|uniref:Uncharacterized protein n=1 Tax=Streptomyces coelicoflavus TaxID=285562 RepID=A0A6N9UNM1_9ACTN|nr:hypothetical protein [Streptomyces coelicoflavus]NEB16692.1 hypothetical protein [Streptomyces coelicoflavus]